MSKVSDWFKGSYERGLASLEEAFGDLLTGEFVDNTLPFRRVRVMAYSRASTLPSSFWYERMRLELEVVGTNKKVSCDGEIFARRYTRP
jgi:hypothetical protein